MSQSPRFVATTILAIAWAALPALLGFMLLANIAPASDWLRSHEAMGLAAYVAIFAFTSGFGLLPTYAQAVLGGWVFGMAIGVPAALGGFLGGSLIGYAITKLIGGDALRERIDAHPRAGVIRKAFVDRGFAKALGIVALLRLPPNSPFALTNLAMAGSGVRLPEYTLGTILGMLPRTALMVGLGAVGAASGANDIRTLVKARGPWQLIAGIVITIVVLLALAKIAKRALRTIDGGAASEPREPAPVPESIASMASRDTSVD
ncbi:MAG: VTT domain-containing protein [Phycisphaerales bacterium]